MKIEINVTQEHIDKGIINSTQHCPVSRAIEERLNAKEETRVGMALVKKHVTVVESRMGDTTCLPPSYMMSTWYVMIIPYEECTDCKFIRLPDDVGRRIERYDQSPFQGPPNMEPFSFTLEIEV